MNSTLTRPAHVRKTKIVATIGPACETPEMLKSMIEAGMNVARLNLSHGTHEAHKDQITRLRVAASQLGKNIAIMIDTRGIEIRTGLLQDDSADLLPGASFSLHTEDRTGDATGVSITYQKLFEEVRQGTPILLDDGAIELEVTRITDGVINCRVIHGGRLGNSKSVNLPETKLALSAVSPENRDDIVKELSFAAENDVDYIAASFIQSADDIHKMREILAEREVNIPIIAKIENRAGVANLEEIVEAAKKANAFEFIEKFGRAWRPWGGTPPGRRPQYSEADHPHDGQQRQAGDHRHPDAGINGTQSETNPR